MPLSLQDPDLRTLVRATLDAAPAGVTGVVVCLCADWCGTCRDFLAAFEQAAATLARLRLRWLDVEAEAHALGDLDIETFPTLVIGSADGVVRFAGPVLPQAGQIARLVQALGLQGTR